MTITEFLLARIAEDETNAKAAIAWVAGGPTPYFGWYGAPGDEVSKRFGGAKGHIVRHSPNRVLAECAAKRAIVGFYEYHRSNRDARRSPRARAAEDEKASQDRRTQEARTRVADDAIRALAAVYVDHPDYRQDWAV
jgi:hypothetical protein